MSGGGETQIFSVARRETKRRSGRHSGWIRSFLMSVSGFITAVSVQIISRCRAGRHVKIAVWRMPKGGLFTMKQLTICNYHQSARCFCSCCALVCLYSNIKQVQEVTERSLNFQFQSQVSCAYSEATKELSWLLRFLVPHLFKDFHSVKLSFHLLI